MKRPPLGSKSGRFTVHVVEYHTTFMLDTMVGFGMDSASQQSVCVAKQPSADSGRFTFNFARTAKLAGNPPTFAIDARADARVPSLGRAYRGGYHPLATGDGHRP